MDSEYPPLPASRAISASIQNISVSDGEGASKPSSGSGTPPISVANGQGQDLGPQPATTVIVHSGDIILEYVPSKSLQLGPNGSVTYRWKVSSESLMQSSPYFRALLDPDKFYEGRHLMNQKKLHGLDVNSTPSEESTVSLGYDPVQIALPTIRLPDNHLSPHLGLDTIELFLILLSINSFDEEEKKRVDTEVRNQRPSSIARLIELADAFNSSQVVRDALERSGYTLGKPKSPLTRFSSSMLKLSEDRIRQTIFIAQFLNHRAIFQMLTHALIVTGSKFWDNGIESPEPNTPRWQYFPDGLEEELYYRRQCVLNTITDLQAYFLRIYGALEEPSQPRTGISNTSSYSSTATPTSQSRQYQCRCGLGNSSACDAFHLGQMTRFFALRTKTIFLGSTLIDPDFNLDSEYEPEHVKSHPPIDLTSLISSLKQCPDYQIDANHTACGIRRRFLPSLDCIEGFAGDERGLLGVNPQYWRGGEGGGTKWPLIPGSWANRSLRRALVIDLRLSRISGIPLMSPGRFGADSREEDARLLFTARKRNWEA